MLKQKAEMSGLYTHTLSSAQTNQHFVHDHDQRVENGHQPDSQCCHSWCAYTDGRRPDRQKSQSRRLHVTCTYSGQSADPDGMRTVYSLEVDVMHVGDPQVILRASIIRPSTENASEKQAPIPSPYALSAAPQNRGGL